MSQMPLPLTPLNTSFYSNKNGLMNGSDGEQLVSPTREEISTIFVVGFPEDMQEREFQNMFLFSSGFEAAMLKVPSLKDGDDDLANNIKKQIVNSHILTTYVYAYVFLYRLDSQSLGHAKKLLKQRMY